MQIRTKKANYEHLQNGRFGNKLQTWPTIGAVLESGYQRPVTIRYNAAGGGGGPCIYSVPINKLFHEVMNLTKEGWELSRFYYNETAPDQLVLLQGELVTMESCGYALHYSTYRAHMRDALRMGPKNHFGPGALLILKKVMTHDSYQDLQELIADFPESAIEFSTYSVCLGDCRGRNTIFWEVRNY